MADMKLKVFSQEGAEVGQVSLSKDVFAIENVNNQVMFDAVVTYQANLRQATAKTKKRDEVSGGGKKPFRQKGTGRARAGSTRSPIWVGGGTVFGPTGEQNFKLKQNKKEHALALRSAWTLKGKKDLVVIDEFKFGGKTKEVVAMLEALKLGNEKVLLVTSDDAVMQAAGNVANVFIRSVGNIAVYDLLNATKVVINKEDIKLVEEGLK